MKEHQSLAELMDWFGFAETETREESEINEAIAAEQQFIEYMTNKQMETTITQDLDALATPAKPINYAYRFGQLNGLLIMLEASANGDTSLDYLKREIAYVAKRRAEIANGEDET